MTLKTNKRKKGRIGGFIVLLEQLEKWGIKELPNKRKEKKVETGGFNSLSTLTMLRNDY